MLHHDIAWLYRHSECPQVSVDETCKTPWWRHQMETLSALLAICAGNSPVTGEFPTQRPVTRSFDVYFDLRPNERLSKQSWGWWFETLSRSLWRHHNALWYTWVPHNVDSRGKSLPQMSWNIISSVSSLIKVLVSRSNTISGRFHLVALICNLGKLFAKGNVIS